MFARACSLNFWTPLYLYNNAHYERIVNIGGLNFKCANAAKEINKKENFILSL